MVKELLCGASVNVVGIADAGLVKSSNANSSSNDWNEETHIDECKTKEDIFE